MTWMLTSRGQQVDLRCIAADTLRIDDVAHHLALVNRWAGATCRPYSVAEHSLLVVEILERDHGISSPGVLMAALMHDAHEAYCGDLSTPMKQIIGERWHDEEARIQRAIQRRFDIGVASAAWASTIKLADLQALATEWRDLIGMPQLMPPSLPAPVAWIDLRTRAGMTWEDWRQAFTDRFTDLAYARALQVAAAVETNYEGPFA
jgi:uncharacterized protein